MDLTTKKYQSISYISGPLLFVDNAKGLSYGAIVEIELPDGSNCEGGSFSAGGNLPLIPSLIKEGTRGGLKAK